MRDLYAGTTSYLLLRTESAEAGLPELMADAADGAPHREALALESIENAAIPLLWVKARIRELQRAKPPQQEAALTLAREHNILCRGAAFIAWDAEQKVAVAARELVQPQMEELERGCASPLLRSGPAPAAASAGFAMREFKARVVTRDTAPASGGGKATQRLGPIPPPPAAPSPAQAAPSPLLDIVTVIDFLTNQLAALISEANQWLAKAEGQSHRRGVIKELKAWIKDLESARSLLLVFQAAFKATLGSKETRSALNAAIKAFQRADLEGEQKLRQISLLLDRHAPAKS